MRGFIAVDGGGSKTELVLVDVLGNVLLRQVVNCTNPNDVGMEQAYSTLFKAIKDCVKFAKKNKIIIENIFLAIAGVEFGNSKQILKDRLASKFKYNIYIDGDLASVKECGLHNKENGIVIISGTGFNMAIKKNNEYLHVGGWGYMADDYLSGFDLGKDALNFASKSINKVDKETILVNLLEKHFNNSLWYSMKEIYDSGVKGVASLSRIVMEAYKKSDKVAKEIVDKRLKKLTSIIKDKTSDMNERVEVVLFGGIFENNEIIVDKFKTLLGEDYNVRINDQKTVFGASMLAKKCIDNEISSEFKLNFDKSYKEMCK